MTAAGGWAAIGTLTAQRSKTLAVGAVAAYLGTLPLTVSLFGGEIGDLVALPTAAVGIAFGTVAGTAFGAFAVVGIQLVLQALGAGVDELISVPHLLLVTVMGAAFGRMGELRRIGEARSAATLRGAAVLRTVVDNAPIVLWAVDRDGRFTLREGRALAAMGFRGVEHVGRDARRYWQEELPEARFLPAALDRAMAGEEFSERFELRGRTLEQHYAPVRDRAGAIDGVVSVAVDITERERLAFYDQLTGLPNRALFNDRLDQAIAAAQRQQGSFALLLIDLDGFQAVNGTLGQVAGDRVLRDVAARLRTVVREVDTVARLGGDEFGVVLVDTDATGITMTADRIQAQLRRPIAIGTDPVEVAASIGVVIHPDHGTDRETLLRHAGVALAQGKRDPGSYRIYTPGGADPAADEVVLLAELRAALESGDIALAYQPIAGLTHGSPLRVEALARWDHPTRGTIAPERFVTLAERTGLVGELTRLVLAKAITQIALWHGAGLDVDVAVNVSGRDLADPGFPDLVAELLRRSGVAPSSLCLEVTETALVNDVDVAIARLAALRQQGVHLAIDDFGTGYSSLAYLSRLPVSELKVDRSFVGRMCGCETSQAIVRAAISLAHDLKLHVTAEGVETEEQLSLLRTLGCDAVQGWALAAALPAADIAAWLRSAPQRRREEHPVGPVGPGRPERGRLDEPQSGPYLAVNGYFAQAR